MAVGLFTLLGCGAHAPRTAGSTTAFTASDGEKLYRRQCRNCHTLPKPQSHADADWPVLIKRHESRVKLTEEQTKALLTFLTEKN